MRGRQLAVYSRRALKRSYRSRRPKSRCLGDSWRYIAGELYRGSYRSRGPEREVLGGSWRYIAGGLCRGGEAEEEERRKEKKDGRRLRNLTTPHRRGGEI